MLSRRQIISCLLSLLFLLTGWIAVPSGMADELY